MNFAITTQEKHARERLADLRPIENGMSVNKSYKLRKRPQYYVAQVLENGGERDVSGPLTLSQAQRWQPGNHKNEVTMLLELLGHLEPREAFFKLGVAQACVARVEAEDTEIGYSERAANIVATVLGEMDIAE